MLWWNHCLFITVIKTSAKCLSAKPHFHAVYSLYCKVRLGGKDNSIIENLNKWYCIYKLFLESSMTSRPPSYRRHAFVAVAHLTTAFWENFIVNSTWFKKQYELMFFWKKKMRELFFMTVVLISSIFEIVSVNIFEIFDNLCLLRCSPRFIRSVRGDVCIQRGFRAKMTNLVAVAGAVVKSKAF